MRVSGIARRLGIGDNPLRRLTDSYRSAWRTVGAPNAHQATEPSPVDRRTSDVVAVMGLPITANSAVTRRGTYPMAPRRRSRTLPCWHRRVTSRRRRARRRR
jgi:hypothetical protein